MLRQRCSSVCCPAYPLGAARILFEPGRVEPVVLWTIAVLESGAGKSPAMAGLRVPVEVFQSELRVAWSGEAPRLAAIRKARLQRVTELQTALAKAKTTAQRSDYEKDIATAVDEANKVEVPGEPHLLASGMTTEALVVKVLATQQRHGATLYSPEGGWLDDIARYDKQAGNDNIDPYLSGYSGEPIDRHRISGAHVTIDVPALAIVSTFQQTVLDKLLKKDSMRQRGFVAVNAPNRPRVEPWLPEHWCRGDGSHAPQVIRHSHDGAPALVPRPSRRIPRRANRRSPRITERLGTPRSRPCSALAVRCAPKTGGCSEANW